MPLVRPGLWYGRPFSLVCSALERDTYLSHSLGRPWGCGFAFRADSLGRELEAEPGRLHLELDCSKFSLPHFSSMSPELSMNGHVAGYELCNTLSRPSSKQNTPQYLASPLDQEVVPCTPSHSSRPRLEKLSGLALPDYTRLSPAKLVLRRHLSQDHTASVKASAGELHPR